MPLNDSTQLILNQIKTLGLPPLKKLDPIPAREQAAQADQFSHKPEPVASVDNRIIPGSTVDIPIRIYTPAGNPPFPILVFFHGGGWVIGSLDAVDSICRTLTNQVGCIVVSVDYRLAPEHKFPAVNFNCPHLLTIFDENSIIRVSRDRSQCDPVPQPRICSHTQHLGSLSRILPG